jgi:hypothetical protein
MPDEEIDFSDIPLITDWSGFRMGLFYRPKWKDFSLKLEEEVIDCLDRGLLDGRRWTKMPSSGSKSGWLKGGRWTKPSIRPCWTISATSAFPRESRNGLLPSEGE